MSGTPVVTLDGVVLEGVSFDWTLKSGTRPHETIYTVTENVADELEGKVGSSVDLIVQPSDGSDPLSASLLYITDVLPGSKPYLRQLRLADRRWLWSRRWLSSTFNLRRTQGDSFLTNDDGNPVEKSVINSRIEYVAFSLFPADAPATPWTAKQVLEYLVSEPAPVGLGTTIRFEGELPEVEIQDLIIDDQGHNAIERVLAFIPGAAIYIDLNGDAVVYDTTDRRDLEVAEEAKLKAPLVTGPDVRVVDRDMIAPRSVISLFTVESEFRFNYAEDASLATDTPNMENVVPVTDLQLTLPSGRTVARSSYVEQSQAFTAWGKFGWAGDNEDVAMSTSLLRERVMAHGGHLLEQMFGNKPGKPFDPVNEARVRAVLNSWRKRYRIDKTFVDRLEAILGYRAGVINVETGARAPADVFCDYIRHPSYKNLGRADSPNKDSGVVVRGYDDSLASARPAPASVRVEDMDAGILSVSPIGDPEGAYAAMVFGYPVDGSIPSLTGPADANRLLQDVKVHWERVKLTNDFKAAIIVTVVPGSPNNARRFMAVETTAASLGLDFSGPTMYSRIFPGIMQARLAWDDSRSGEFAAAVRGEQTWESLKGQMVNAKDVNNVASANAKRIFEGYRKRPIGGVDIALDPSMSLIGSMSSIRHVMARGSTVTQPRFGGGGKPLDIWRFMDSSTRRVILRTLTNRTGM